MSDRIGNVDRFGWQGGDISISQCAYCAHKQNGAICRAFPSGIPIAVLRNEHDHRQPHPGDHGIQFAPLPGERHPLEGE